MTGPKQRVESTQELQISVYSWDKPKDGKLSEKGKQTPFWQQILPENVLVKHRRYGMYETDFVLQSMWQKAETNSFHSFGGWAT